MATYKKQLRDKDNNVIYPAQGLGTITNENIDWSTMPGSYSTTEQTTPFTWIDGKPIYKKTINFGALPNATTKNVAHGVSGLSQLVKIEAIMNRPGTNGGFYPLPFVSKSAANDQVEVSVNDTNVSIATNINWSSCTAYVTIYYTKS